MIKLSHILISCLLSFTLMLPYAEVYAALSPKVSAEAQNLMSEYLLMTKGIGNEELIAKFGERWINNAQKFIARHQDNKDFLKSKEFDALGKSTGLLTNYLAVKKHFDSCIKDPANKRQLAKRTLSVILQNEKEVNPCDPKLRGFNNFSQFYKTNMQLMKKLVTPQYEKEIKKQVLTNSLLALFRFERKFGTNKFNAYNKNTHAEMNSLIHQVCFPMARIRTDQCREFGNNFKEELLKKMQEETPKIFAEKKYTPTQAMTEINNKLGALNTLAKNVSVEIDKGILYDSPQEINDENKEHFQKYIQTYLQHAGEGAGVLLLTEKIKDKAGGLRSLEDNLEKNKKKKAYKLEPHYKVSEKEVSGAIHEARGKILQQVKDLPQMGMGVFGGKDQQSSIDDLSAANPFAIGQILARNPEYAGLACDSFNRISSDDRFNEKMDKAFFVGTAVLSGALILTGVGTVAGAYLLTGSLTAGVAAGTVGGSILATTALVGTATELTSAAYYGSRAYDEARELDRMEKAIFTDNSDDKSIQEAHETLKAFKEARLQLALNLAGAVGSYAIGATKIPALVAGKSLSIGQLKIVNNILNRISDSTTAVKLLRAINLIKGPAEELLERFVIALSKTSESSRQKFLKMLHDAKITPEKLKEIIGDALKASKNCP